MVKNNLFNIALAEQGITLKEFCQIWNINYRTAQNWRLGNARIPDFALKLIKLNYVKCPKCNNIFYVENNVKYCPYCSRSLLND